MSEYIIRMTNIVKSYGVNEVLHGVDFNLEKGSIHALLGENGTGKSTLMNILAGIIPCNSGKVEINGKGYELKNSYVPTQKDIGFIHQELALVNDLNIFENIFMGREIKNGVKLDKKKMAEKTKSILNYMDIDLDPYTMVRDLNASYKQVVEVARSLLQEGKVIIMDEPTTALTNVETEQVFRLMRTLSEKGVSIIFISHKLNEVIEICDSYTIMRDGTVVDTGKVTAETTEAYMARRMIGKDLSYDDIYSGREQGEEILRTEHLKREREFDDVNISVKRGEIVGITGLLGDGRYEVANTVIGNNKKYDGKIFIHGAEIHMDSIRKALKNHISYLPRNRKENGIIADMDIEENITVPIMRQLKKAGVFLNHKESRGIAASYQNKLNIKLKKLDDNITSLSGGNQQKVIFARTLCSKPELVILDNPTQGVDVGAKIEIYKLIHQLAKEGVSFLVLSGEAQEVMCLCDRIYVMFHGEVRTELDRSNATEENIMIAATGGKVERG